jgi:hypothetical protein
MNGKEEAVPPNARAKVVLVAGCCAGSLAVGLILGGGSLWFSRAPPSLPITAPVMRPQAIQPTAPSKSAAGSPVAKTPDGRLIHPVTGQACPKDMKPFGRRGCVGYCPEEDMYFWEKTGRCIPKTAAKVACEESAGTWIATVDTHEERCRIPLTEIDPNERQRLYRLERR